MKLAWPAALSGIATAIFLFTLQAYSQEGAQPKSSAGTFEQTVRPFLETHCFECHEGPDPEGDFGLDTSADAHSVAKDTEKWSLVLKKVRAGEMPPKAIPRPEKAELDRVIAVLQKSLQSAAAGNAGPGKVTIRRLNRVEYANTVRDLLGVDFNADEQFPADDVGYGFDNIGDVLSLSPLLMEKYLAAAEEISQEALESPSRSRWITAAPKADTSLRDAVRDVLQPLLSRAYRRPATEQEVDRLVRLAKTAGGDNQDFDAGIRLALKAVLVSPHIFANDLPTG